MRQEDYAKHQVHTPIKSISDMYVSLDKIFFENPIVADGRNQFEYLVWCLEKSDASILTQQLLDQLNSHLTQAQGQIQSLPADPNGYGNNAIQNFSDAMNILAAPRRKVLLKSEAAEAIRYSRSQIEKVESSFRNEIASLSVQPETN